MPANAVRVVAPSRLHFGMLSFGQPGLRQFGGAGLMIDTPGWEIRFTRAELFSASGASAARATEFATTVAGNWNLPHDATTGQPPCHIEIVTAPRTHVGLGTGTQLGMSIASGLHALFRGGPQPEVAELAQAVGRGERSAIGSYGFALGGLIVEGGKLEPQGVSPLIARLEVPHAWRLLLACPRQVEGLSGEDERRAFRQLPPVPRELTADLCRQLLLELLPAVADADWTAASRSLFEYGQLAGSCFSTQQGGVFASPAAQLVEWFRSRGVEGVAQSSWGPLVFALAPDLVTAQSWQAELLTAQPTGPLDSWIAGPCNRGATITSE